MCGIIGFVGRREAVETLIQGLRRLEYRGYDSSGGYATKPGTTAGRQSRSGVATTWAISSYQPFF